MWQVKTFLTSFSLHRKLVNEIIATKNKFKLVNEQTWKLVNEIIAIKNKSQQNSKLFENQHAKNNAKI